MSSAILNERSTNAMGLEMPDSDVITRLITLSADIATIKSTVSRLDTVIGNGGGLVAKVNRLEATQVKDRAYVEERLSQLWDHVKLHRGKSLIVAGSGGGLVSAISAGLQQLWPIITHTPAVPASHPIIFPAAGTVSFILVVIGVMSGKGKGAN